MGDSTLVEWQDAFRPVTEARTLDARPQQAALGAAVLNSYNTKKSLVAEAKTGTGKSYAYLVPAILATRDKKRTVVSTETLALMDQLVDRDLPFLHSIYRGFGYRALKGRSNYLCLNRMRMWRSSAIYCAVDDHMPVRYGDGEKRDVERVLGREVTPDEWKKISGEAEYCASNKCDPERCFSTRARVLAAEADIVVTNHAMLRTDADMRDDASDGILGSVHMLILDEGHTLEQVLVDGWTEEVSPWDIRKAHDSVFEGLERAADVVSITAQLREETEQAFKAITGSLDMVTKFFELLAVRQGRDLSGWRRENAGIHLHYLSGAVDDDLRDAMEDYEVSVPRLMSASVEILDRVEKKLLDAEAHIERGVRKVRKGLTAIKKMRHTLELILKSLTTRDGVIDADSTYYAVIGEGIIFKDERSLRIRVVPLDVSWRCERSIWRGRTVVITSATLTDPTDGSFTYLKSSLGMSNNDELQVDSPFDYAQNQLVYITDGSQPAMNVNGAQSSIDELVEVITASNGRTLVLFTARAELDHAADELRDHGLEWPILVQDEKADKQKLANEFRSQEHSVLLATKSFFTGVDFPGHTCSTVAICKFPLPQYNALCKIQIAWWRRRGFPQWYEREALTTFAQAAGRLIRTSSDKGVIALLDQRVANPKHNVHRTAMIGINGLHVDSRIVTDIADIKAFLN